MSTARNPQPLIVSKTNGSMITAQFPDGSEITSNRAFFRSVPDTPPELLVQTYTEMEPTVDTLVPDVMARPESTPHVNVPRTEGSEHRD